MQEFSISDLEAFTGVKAHTIRIWEQRYGLLNPHRTDTNIRVYSDRDLKKLINVSMLNRLGFKISRIVAMTDDEIQQILVKSHERDSGEQHLLNMLKIAMLNFDSELFTQVCEHYIHTHSMDELLEEVFVPFLQELGILWQTSAICPAHEHFVSNLFRQHLSNAIQSVDEPLSGETNYVLFLPPGELHELALMMVHYQLRRKGCRTVYLGQSVPLEDLGQVFMRVRNCVFVSHLTNQSSTEENLMRLREIQDRFGDDRPEFWVSGPMFKDEEVQDRFFVRYRIGKLVEELITAR